MERIVVGHFGQSYGIKGWLKVNSHTDPIENILHYKQLQIYHHGQWQEIEITEMKTQGKGIIAKLANCHNPEQARNYTNDAIAIFRHQLPELPPEEYYWADLIGLRVINQQGIDFGIVDHLFTTGSNDVMVIKGDRQRLVPYINSAIQLVDITDKKIIVDWDADF